MNRRIFLQYMALLVGSTYYGCSSQQIPSTPVTTMAQDPDNFNSLLIEQYANVIRLRQLGGKYFGYNFQLTDTPTNWHLTRGRYNGRVKGEIVNWTGYWIFHEDGRRCWQAAPGSRQFVYWNEDNRATGHPEDWELYKFVTVNAQQQTVKIQSARSFPGAPGPFVDLVGNQFSLKANLGTAAIFVVEFLPSLPSSASGHNVR